MNVPFATVKKFFDLANIATRDKIKDIKIEFWTDDSRMDALCTLAFKGWISSWNVTSGMTLEQKCGALSPVGRSADSIVCNTLVRHVADVGGTAILPLFVKFRRI